MKYQQRTPVTVEAFRFGFEAPPEWLTSRLSESRHHFLGEVRMNDELCVIRNEQGLKVVDRGDFIVLAQPHLLSMKAAEFHQTFQLAQ